MEILSTSTKVGETLLLTQVKKVYEINSKLRGNYFNFKPILTPRKARKSRWSQVRALYLIGREDNIFLYLIGQEHVTRVFVTNKEPRHRKTKNKRTVLLIFNVLPNIIKFIKFYVKTCLSVLKGCSVIISMCYLTWK